MNKARRTMLAKMMVVVFAVVMSVSLSAKADGFDLTTAQTDDTKVKSYKNGTDEALGTEFTFAVQPAWKLFADYGEYSTANRAITASFSSNKPVDIVYEFDTATAINAYKIQTSTTTGGTSHNTRAPHEWKFFGSTDGTTWTKLDSQSVASWNKSEQKSFMFFNDTAYRYYRLMITANGGDSYLELFSLEYGYVSGNYTIGESGVALTGDIGADFSIGYIDRTIDIAGHTLTVSALTGGGTVTDSSAPVYKTPAATTLSADLKGNSGYLFDGETTTFVYNGSDSSDPVYAVFDFGNGTQIDHYDIYAYSSVGSPGFPAEWTFAGSDDGSEWTVLDSRSGVTMAKNNWYGYDFANAREFRYYRLHVTKGSRWNSSTKINPRIDVAGEMKLGCRKPGSLVVDVTQGKTVENSDVTLSGNLRLVKDGAGTLVASKADQTYTGGTEVSEGTLKCGAALAGLFGQEGGEIRISDGGTFDIAGIRATGVNALGKYSFVLDGGVLANSAAISGSSNYQSPMKLSLASDSSLDISDHGFLGTETAGLTGNFDLGGHTLSCTIADAKFFRINNMTLKNGAFKVLDATTGRVFIGYGEGVVATNVDFTLNCPLIVRTGCTFKVRDYEALGSADHTYNQTGTMEVYGAFKPTGDYWCGCTLMNGATLDLSTRTAALDAVSSLSYNKDLSFEENAVVNVVLGEKRFSSGGKILSWTSETKPANIDTVKFVRADADRRYSLVVKSDGLYASEGLTITFY